MWKFIDRMEAIVWPWLKWPYVILLFGTAILTMLNWPLDFMNEVWENRVFYTFEVCVLSGWVYYIFIKMEIVARKRDNSLQDT